MALGKSIRFHCEVCGADLTDKAVALFQKELDQMGLTVRDLHNLAVKNLKGENVEQFLLSHYSMSQRTYIEMIGRQLLYIAFGVLVCDSCKAPAEEW